MATLSNNQDTAPDAESVLLDLIRNQSPTERLRLAFSASQRVADQCKQAIARQHPDYSEDEIKLRFIELNYGKTLSDEVREWLATRRQS